MSDVETSERVSSDALQDASVFDKVITMYYLKVQTLPKTDLFPLLWNTLTIVPILLEMSRGNIKIKKYFN